MRRAAALLLALAPVPALASVVPSAGGGDPRIQYVGYDPTEVVLLSVAPGYALTVRLAPDERIETVTVGDAGAWQVQVDRRADAFTVKPNGAVPPSDLVVLTDQRSYSFSLVTGSARVPVPPFLVSFSYPPLPPAPPTVTVAPAASYTLKGDAALWPKTASDDGQFTSLTWGPDVPLPAVYAEDRKGELALVNGVMKEGAYVVDGIHRRYVFVRGKAKASADRVAGQ